jgi:hypothetical protein
MSDSWRAPVGPCADGVHGWRQLCEQCNALDGCWSWLETQRERHQDVGKSEATLLAAAI